MEYGELAEFGLRRTIGNRVNINSVSRVQIPYSPPFTLDGGLAAPCNLQSATAGLNSQLRKKEVVAAFSK